MPTRRFGLDPQTPPRLSEATKARYDATTDDEIEYGDIPDMGAVDWRVLDVRQPRAKPTVTMRLEDDA